MVCNIEIKEWTDYFSFFLKYVGTDNDIKTEFQGAEFVFQIIFERETDIDEQILFDYYLISDKYGKSAHFSLEVHILEEIDNKRMQDAYFSLSAYGFFQEFYRGKDKIIKTKEGVRSIKISSSKIIDGKGQERRFYVGELKGIRRLVPVFSINKEHLQLLCRGINRDTWTKILNGQNASMDEFKNAVYRLCWRLLFSDVGNGNKHLSILRQKAFNSEIFFNLIDGIPLIALLIFAMLDYSFREDAVEHYKKNIKSIKKSKKVDLCKKDFLYELQYLQDRDIFIASQMTSAENYDNKTIWATENKVIHPFIVKEMYEALTISEGIIQLAENIVYHAGKGNDDGVGFLGIYIRNFEKDKNVFQKKYPEYINFCQKGHITSKYHLELLIGDLSGTDISQKFMDNNRNFINDNRKELMQRIYALGGSREVPVEVPLRSFFKPNDIESEFWTAFFSFPDKAVNHYGLQIFDSIISTKGGLFEVESGKNRYCNRDKRENTEQFNGSRYSVVFPVNGYSSADTNIYDSMLSYDYNRGFNYNGGKKLVEGMGLQLSEASEEKRQYINEVIKRIKRNGTQLLCIDMNSFSDTECVIKALLLYVFEEKIKNSEKIFYIALLKCKTYQIVNIVRILALFYNKQGRNIKMKNVQVYMRGENVGEEILFYGETLQDVKNNIVKCACIRGTMFDSLSAINKVLERSGGLKDE